MSLAPSVVGDQPNFSLSIQIAPTRTAEPSCELASAIQPLTSANEARHMASSAASPSVLEALRPEYFSYHGEKFKLITGGAGRPSGGGTSDARWQACTTMAVRRFRLAQGGLPSAAPQPGAAPQSAWAPRGTDPATRA